MRALFIPGVLIAIACGGATARGADAEAGKTAFKAQCGICHSVEPGRNMIGPSLHGVIGKKSGSAPGFHYTAANQNANIVWTAEELDLYLVSPKTVVPGTSMIFAGLKDASKRADLIAYLETLR